MQMKGKDHLYKIITYIGVGFFAVLIFYSLYIWAADFNDAASGIPGDLVLGQTDFLGTGFGCGANATASKLCFPTGFQAVGSQLLVTDSTNDRVLIWNTLTPANGDPANIVLGQDSFTTGSANKGGDVASSTLSNPSHAFSDGSKIYVADTDNNRVLIWNTTSPADGAGADIVLGQDVFTASSTNKGGAVSSSTLSLPSSVFSDGSKIYVADTGNHRVLIWNTTSPENGAGADIVLGQSSFTAGSIQGGEGIGPQAHVLASPRAVAKDDSRIYVLDASNNRVLIWNTTDPVSGASADIVLGQDNFTSGTANKGGSVSSSTLSTASAYAGLFSDNNNLFVTDPGSNRVLIWTTTTPSNGSGANVVVGKNIFTDATVIDFNHPAGVYFSGTKLYVADMNQNRVLRFDMVPSAQNAPSVNNVTTSSLDLTFGSSSHFSFAEYAINDRVSSEYVNLSSQMGSDIVWAPSTTWQTPHIEGLTPGRQYQLRTAFRYIAGVSATSSYAAFYTDPADPGAPTVSADSDVSLAVNFDTNGNHSSVEYALYNVTNGYYLGLSYTESGSPVFAATSTWGSVVESGLSPNTGYEYVVVGRNGAPTYTATSTTSTLVYTLASVAGTPSTTAASSEEIIISFDTNGNPTSTEYAIYNETTGNYIAISGAATASAVYQTSSSWDGIGATGLSANTPYQFAVIARNGSDVDSATSTTSTAVYTLANTPSSVSASAGSNSVVLSWSGDGTAYYAENVTAGTNNGWSASTQATFSGLSCGTSYTFRVKAKNGADVETSFASVTATTAGCGGGGVISAPTVLPVNALIINGGQKETEHAVVSLTLNASEAAQVAIANTPDFAFSSFVPYKSAFTWTLSPGYGAKTVYVKFRTKNGSESVASQTITVKQKLKPVAEKVQQKDSNPKNADTAPAGKTACALQPNTPYKIRTASDVWYVTPQCTRKLIKNPDVYFTHFTTWRDVLIVSKEDLASIAKDAVLELPFGERYVPPHGTFITVQGDETIYYVLGNKKIILGSEQVFTGLKYKKEWIERGDKKMLDRYELLDIITDTKSHLDLTLIKYASSPKVYLLEYGKKRHITSEKTLFHNRPFRFDRIIVIDDSETYPDGEPIR